jgi:hypothetical protein
MSDFLKNPVRGQTRLLLKKEGRDKCLALYEEWVRDKIDKEGVEELMKIKDKILGCWCKPEKCHGDILVKIINELNDTRI